MSGVKLQPDIAGAAALFGDPARAAMLMALLDHPTLSVSELALAANVSPQTATFHLAKLTSAALLVGVRRGRNHLYRLSGPVVARAIESLAAVSSAACQLRNQGRFNCERLRQLRAARTCYDHLAGKAGVILHDCLMAWDYLVPGSHKEYELTAKGREWFSHMDGPAHLLHGRSPFARLCVDWTEQRPHLAGRLAAFLLDRFFAERWIARIRDTRAVRITERGLREFERQYGIDLRCNQLTP